MMYLIAAYRSGVRSRLRIKWGSSVGNSTVRWQPVANVSCDTRLQLLFVVELELADRAETTMETVCLTSLFGADPNGEDLDAVLAEQAKFFAPQIYKFARLVAESCSEALLKQ